MTNQTPLTTEQLKLLNGDVAALEIPVSAFRRLELLNITGARQLVTMTEAELNSDNRMGSEMPGLRKALRQKGFHFGMVLPENIDELIREALASR